MSFSAQASADLVLANIDLTGAKVLVTGASSGLGLETARALASRGAQVTITARDGDKLSAAARQIYQLCGQQVDSALLALDKPDSIEAFASRYLASNHTLDILINNAGVMACPLMRTKEGWELQFATNHLGPFLLTNLLLPALASSQAARVVNLSSGGHFGASGDLADVNFHHTQYQAFAAYRQSKLFSIWFSNQLQRRFAALGIDAFSVAPGAIKTALFRHLSAAEIAAIDDYLQASGIGYKSLAQGAATSCWAASAAELKGQGGRYLADCAIAPPGDSMADCHSPMAYNPQAEQQLWQLSNQLLASNF